MIINNKHQFVFVHVPKVAGTSVSTFLSKMSTWSDVELGSTNLGEAILFDYHQRFGLTKHSTVSEIRKVIGQDLWEKYFTFGFVRNPYERAYSVWGFLRWIQQDRDMKRHEVLKTLDTFPKFVESDYFRGDGIDRLLRPQFFWMRANQETEAIGVKYVGRLEKLGESMKEIALRIGVQEPDMAEFPTKNESAEPSSIVWKELEAHAWLEEALYARYEVDFRMFGYPRFLRGGTR